MEKLSRGSYDYQFDENNKKIIVKWNDNKCVLLATNFDTVEPPASVQRWSREQKERVLDPQPNVVYNYSRYSRWTNKTGTKMTIT
jgi:hypothetical protein